MLMPHHPAATTLALLLLATLAGAGGARADDVVRHPLSNPGLPILSAVEIPPSKTLVVLSGAGAPVSDPAAPARTLAAYGDTRAQTVGALTGIAGTLKGLGLTLGDVVNMTVFLVGNPAMNGRMDFDGFMEGYRQFFGGPDQPRLPTRSTVQVVGLANPGWLVEIEVTAVRP